MKQLTCEMCGSTDLLKQDGVFVCQSCGCKYSIEEAKKMMVEGTVDVSGSTVKVDNSAFVAKYLANARRAKEKEDWEEVEKYYNMVEQNDPDNIEAIFYSAYGKAKTTLTDSDIYKREAAFTVLKNCISVIDDHYQIERREQNQAAINSIANDLAQMICSNFVYTEWKNGYGMVTRTDKIETYRMFGALLDAFKETIGNIAKIDNQSYLHEASIRLYKVALSTGNWGTTLMQKWINEENQELAALQRKMADAYWKEHAEEKAVLEQERSSLHQKLEELDARSNAIPERKTARELQSKIDALEAERSALGLFKVKERRALQEQIDGLDAELRGLQACVHVAEAEIQKKGEPLRARIGEIDSTLSSIPE